MNSEVLSLGSHEYLRQVLWLSVRDGPLKITWLESWFGALWWWNWVAFLIKCWLRVLFVGIIELFMFDILLINGLVLIVELKSNNGLDLSDVLLDIEELIH